MNILVCGGTGFIGRNMTEHFARQGHQVTATHFTREAPLIPGVSFVRIDLRDHQAVQGLVTGFDLVIQAAATTTGSKDVLTRPYIHVTDNVLMNSLIFRAAHDAAIPQVVFFSCSVMYRDSDEPLTEDDFRPGDEIAAPYFGAGWMKVYLEKQAEFFSRQGKTRYLIIRHSNIYGPYDKFDLDRSHVFGATITKVLHNTDGVLRVWGTGRAERDLLHVDDLVRMVDAAVQDTNRPYRLYNVGSGEAVSILDLVKRIIRASGKSIRVELDPSGPDIQTRLCLNSARVEGDLGWRPRIPLDEGITRTFAWAAANGVR